MNSTRNEEIDMKKKKSVVRKILDIFSWIILAIALGITVLSVSAYMNDKDYPVVFNRCMMTVKSDSMHNEEDGKGFDKGDIVFGKVVTEEQSKHLTVGQVISFTCPDIDGDGENDVNSHRIVHVSDEVDGYVYYTTAGDNQDSLNSITETVRNDRIRFVVSEKTVLEGAGNVLNYLQSADGFLVCVVLPMGILFVYELVIFISTIAKNKAQKEVAGSGFTAEEEELIKQKAIEEYLAKQKEEKKKK